MPDGFEVSRRDFLNGAALSLAAGTAFSPLELLAGSNAAYPPALDGMRGSHPGSYEVAHALAWQGKQFTGGGLQTEASYDLVIAGGGISGLAAAYLYRQRAATEISILILDNHDDFGGHAKRNELCLC